MTNKHVVGGVMAVVCLWPVAARASTGSTSWTDFKLSRGEINGAIAARCEGHIVAPAAVEIVGTLTLTDGSVLLGRLDFRTTTNYSWGGGFPFTIAVTKRYYCSITGYWRDNAGRSSTYDTFQRWQGSVAIKPDDVPPPSQTPPAPVPPPTNPQPDLFNSEELNRLKQGANEVKAMGLTGNHLSEAETAEMILYRYALPHLFGRIGKGVAYVPTQSYRQAPEFQPHSCEYLYQEDRRLAGLQYTLTWGGLLYGGAAAWAGVLPYAQPFAAVFAGTSSIYGMLALRVRVTRSKLDYQRAARGCN